MATTAVNASATRNFTRFPRSQAIQPFVTATFAGHGCFVEATLVD